MVQRIILLLSFVILLAACCEKPPALTGDIDEETQYVKTGNLSDILQSYKPDYALLIASDGLAALITETAFSEIEIERNANVWRTTSETLPAFCNVDSLQEVCLFRIEADEGDSLSFRNRITQYQRIGSSEKNGYPAWKYRRIQ